MDWAILGCGYVGGRLARALLKEGHRVRVCARNVARLDPLKQAGAEVHAIDAHKLRAFGPALFGLRSPVVVYSIPPVPGMPPGEAIRRATEASRGVGAARFIYLSSTAVYGETEDGATVDEESSISIGDAQAGPRIAEESAVDGARLAGLNTIILRLSAIYGPGRGVRERLKKGDYQLVDGGMHFFSRVHVDDLVGILRAAVDRAPAGALYCVADDRPSTQKEYADWLTARLGTKPPKEVASLEAGKPRRAVRNRKVSNARLKRELAYTFRHPSFVEGEAAIEAEQGAAVPAPVPAPAPAPPEPRPLPDQRLLPRIREIEKSWTEVILHELRQLIVHLDADRFAEGSRLLERLAQLAGLLARQLESFEISPEPMRLEAIAAEVWTSYERARGRHPQPALLSLARALSEFDAAMQRWRAPQPGYFPSLKVEG